MRHIQRIGPEPDSSPADWIKGIYICVSGFLGYILGIFWDLDLETEWQQTTAEQLSTTAERTCICICICIRVAVSVWVRVAQCVGAN